MRREQRESSYSSDIDEIDAIKRSFRESSQSADMHQSRADHGWTSLSSSELVQLERKYSRGKSEERYPHEYRGRSLSPTRRTPREARAASALPTERASYQPRGLSPIRETMAMSRRVEEAISRANSEAAATEQKTASELAKEITKKIEDENPYFIPRYFYPYYRPYFRVSPSELDDIIKAAKATARRYLTPRPFDYLYTRPNYYSYRYPESNYQPYEPKTPAPEPKPQSSFTKSETYTPSSYNPYFFRPHYTYPNITHTRTFLPRHYYM